MFISTIRVLQLFMIILSLVKRRSIFSDFRISISTRSFIFRVLTILISLLICAVTFFLFRKLMIQRFKLTYSFVISDSAMLLTLTDSDDQIWAADIICLRKSLSIKVTEQFVLKQTSWVSLSQLNHIFTVI